MSTMIPAARGTYLLDARAHRVAVIVGWQLPSGNTILPIFAHARAGVRRVEAILHGEGGLITHPHSNQTFECAEEWMEYAAHVSAEDAPEAVADSPDRNGKLVFSDKTYKTKSFWHWPEANAVFEIEPDQPYPHDARALKIKRDEWFNLKRDGAVKIDPHAGTIDEDQGDAEDATSAAPADDDDGMDVV